MDTPGSADSFPPRHGCLTAWLVATLCVAAASIPIAPLTYALVKMSRPSYSPLDAALIVCCSVTRLIATIALLKWRRWGFYAIAVVDIIAVINNLILGLGIGLSILGLVGLALLYWLLNIGEEKAWDSLR